MKRKIAIFEAIFLALLVCPCLAAAPYSNQPGPDPNIPIQFGSGRSAPLVPLPPQVPPYLPNGAVNLDYVWTQDGGARLYWNEVIIPQELKMGGATWIDPALVPQLLPQKQVRPARRYYTRRYAKKRPVAKAKVPTKVASTKLRSPSPAIPLPVTPVEAPKDNGSIPPLKVATPSRVSPADQEVRTITPPPLQ